MTNSKYLTSFALVVAATLAFGAGAPRGVAGELDREQQQTILQEANRLYERGAANSEDQALSKESYQAAAVKYQTLIDDGVQSWQMYFNLGNAYLQSGSLGRAIVNYERAAALTGNPTVHANLEHARSLVQTEPPAELPQSTYEAAVAKLSAIPMSTVALVAVFSWICFWVAISFRSRSWQRTLNLTGTVAAIMFLSAALLIADHNPEAETPEGIVTSKQGVLREGNGTAFAPRDGLPLEEGEEVRVLEHRGDWFNVKTQDGRQGWLSHSDVEAI